jgi:hypothetical protein
MIPAATKNNMLDGQPIDTMSLHSGFPGSTGANEISGGAPAYARKSATVAAASGGSRSLSSAINFDVPASTIKWLGFYNGATYVECAPNGGKTPKNFMAIPSTDVVYSTGHGYTDGTKITFYNGTPPGGLTEGVTYFTRDGTTDSFKVAATLGGAAIDLTSASSFGCVVCEIVEDVYASQGVHQVATGSISIPD